MTTPSQPSPTSGTKLSRGLWFTLAALTVLVLDQVTKDLIILNLVPHVSYSLFGNLVRLYLVYNNSAAFSLGFGVTWIFTIISSLSAIAILWFSPRVRTHGWALMVGVALGGVTGNLADRLTRPPGFPSGQVVDFIQIPFNFPIFNLADMAIVIVASLVVITLARGGKLGG
ncbi:MAG: hypothetical protein RL243_1343 [Actinomycetota bacterium]